MCKASVVAHHVTNARPGESYQIGISSHGLGAFHPEGKTTEECVACVKNGTMLTFSAIPRALRRQFGLKDIATAKFIDTGDNQHDLLEFENGQQPYLHDFANHGIVAYVGVHQVAAAPQPSTTDHVSAPERELALT